MSVHDAPATGPTVHLDVADALARLPATGDPRSVALFAHGTLLVELYAPRGRDPQTPHTRDELYVVARGGAVFFDGTARRPVVPGTLLFVEAGREHRFEELSEDFAVWVAFYGLEGGEGRGSTPHLPPNEPGGEMPGPVW